MLYIRKLQLFLNCVVCRQTVISLQRFFGKALLVPESVEDNFPVSDLSCVLYRTYHILLSYSVGSTMTEFDSFVNPLFIFLQVKKRLRDET